MPKTQHCPELARDAIQQLQAAGLNPTLDHIAELIELARRVQEPNGRVWPYLSYSGIYAAGHRFRPLSIKAELWFDWVLDNLDSETLQTYAFAYASENGHLPETDFTLLYDRETALSALAGYASGLACNTYQLEAALARVMDLPTDGDKLRAQKSTTPDNLENTIAQLVAVTGLPEEHWHSKTLSFGIQVLEHALQFSSGSFAGAENLAESPEYQRANFDFMACLQRIEQELKEFIPENG